MIKYFFLSDNCIIFVADMSSSKHNLKAMNIEKRLTDGCDKMSRVYEEMFNALQEVMQDEEKLNSLSPLDYSALGMYIGKFVEQEINSSVVQIMRAFCGIDMPEYYCKRDPGFEGDADVERKNKKVRLNEQKPNGDRTSLRTIALGDAYYALEILKEEDKKGFFNDYPWLSDRIFLEAWRNLFVFRNRMAHIGEIIEAKTLKENYEYFLRFLRYMPDISEAKRKLSPKDFYESLPTPGKVQKVQSPYIVTENPPCDKPFAPKEVAQRYIELDNAGKLNTEYYDICEKYNLDAIIFEGSDGKKGIKDCLDNILVPAKYDGFGFIPKPFVVNRKSINAVRNGKYVLVKLDGSGEELTKEPYDEIRLATYYHLGSPYVYRKNGMKAWGFMNTSGVEVCDNIIDNYSWGLNSMWYDSGDLMGYWQFYTIFLPPIYDNIEMIGEPDDPLVFTLNGVQGYVKLDGTFVPSSELKGLDEDEQWDILSECICEQYD